jgi:outer membrane protein TolC
MKLTLAFSYKKTKIHRAIKQFSHIVFASLSTLIISPYLFADQSISFAQAEQKILRESYTTQANDALQQASKLEAEAVKNLGLPRIDLNVRAYALHKEVEVPLGALKNNLDQTLTQNVGSQIDQWSSNNPSNSGLTDSLKEGVTQGIHDGVGLIPNKYNFDLDDEVVRPTVSFMMPIYTGGLTTNAKEAANLKAKRSELNTQQQQDIQRFELIQAYFNVQLQKQLFASSQNNLQAMQNHYNNAIKLENQGFISKGQRMQFEVAKNNALRTQQNTEANYKASLFTLNNLLQSSDITQLTTPLFVNTTQSQSLNALLKSFPEQSTLIRKMQMDTQLAETNVKLQSAAKKPNVFAFGEYSLDDKQDWIVGIAAKYNLFSGIDKNKNVQAAELQKYASELLTARTKQEIENLIYKSFSEATTAQQSDNLLQENLKAAQENLRIQELSFKEDMGTANQVIDAQNMLSALKAETAMNAYKYVMSLATLLQSHGSIDQFQSYINQPNTRFIK